MAKKRQVDNRLNLQKAIIKPLTEEAIRDRVLAWVQTQRCWRKSFAKTMQFAWVTAILAFRYELNSYCEDRKIRWRWMPYRGDPIDGPENGAIPGVWDVNIPSPLELFKPTTISVGVPHTCEILTCGWCHGAGNYPCTFCDGKPKNCAQCWGSGILSEGGEGHHTYYFCPWCRGTRQACLHCFGMGTIQCNECEGVGYLMSYMELIVRYFTMTDVHVHNISRLPKPELQHAQGERIMEQVRPRVSPIQDNNLPELVKASQKLIRKHTKLQQRVLYQGHHLEAIPITEAAVADGNQGQLILDIFGNQLSVFFPDYPQKSGCC